MTPAIRLLIVDDQDLVRSGLSAILRRQPGMLVIGEARDGLEAVDLVAALAPDVVIMDVRMPRLDGIEATRRLTALPDEQRPRVLMLTTFDLDEYVYAALGAGASGFLLKDSTAEELAHAVRVVAAGDALLAPSVTRRLIEEFARRPARLESRLPRAARVDALTHRERDVLGLLTQGLSNAEIAAALVLGEATVKTHVAHILAKLELRDRVQAVVYAYETGLVRPEPGAATG